jgi:hypothetical protein
MSAQHLSRLSMERLCMLSMRMERLCVLRGASVCAQRSVCVCSEERLCVLSMRMERLCVLGPPSACVCPSSPAESSQRESRASASARTAKGECIC